MAFSYDAISPMEPMNLDPVNCDELKVNLFRDSCMENSTIPSSVSEEKCATFLRIRPLENLCLEDGPYKIIDSNLLCVEEEKEASHVNGKKATIKKRRFVNFNEIFDETSTQRTIFSKCCLPLVNDALTGTNALLFCFGTTSSGKSYTMRGPPNDPTSDPGLIPLSLKKIFKSRKFLDEPLIGKSKFCDIFLLNREQQEIEMEFKSAILSSSSCRNISAFCEPDDMDNVITDDYQNICYLSYFEIYNGFIYDLLVQTSSGRGPALSIYPDDKQRYFVKDLKSILVSSLTEALQVYSFGWTNLQRNIQSTALNKNSSRSHSFLCITLIKFKEYQGQLLESQVSHLTLGDLAGSERQNKTQSEGLRVKEGGNINVSLMHLKECFNQTKLSQKNPNKNTVIQFRNSNLTKFFQPYLTGTGRVWMIVNINPSPTLFQETLGSLDFGETASHISVNSTYHAKLEESKRRMTQMWLQSSQRWSSFANKSKVLEIPEIVIEEDADLKTMQHGGEVVNKAEIEGQIRREVMQQFEEILSDIQNAHEKDLQVTQENYEKTMEARLAFSDRKYKAIIHELQEKIDNLTSQLFDSRENIVQLEDKLALVRPPVITSDREVFTEEKLISVEELNSQLENLRAELTPQVVMTTVKEVQTEHKFIAVQELNSQLENLRVELTPKAVMTAFKEVQTEHELIPVEELNSQLENLRAELTPQAVTTAFKEVQTTPKAVVTASKEVQTTPQAVMTTVQEVQTEHKFIAIEELNSQLENLRAELTPHVVVTAVQEVQTEHELISIEELNSQLENLRAELTPQAVTTAFKEVQTTPKAVVTAFKEVQTTPKAMVTAVQKAQTEHKFVPEFGVRQEVEAVSEASDVPDMDSDSLSLPTPRRSRRTSSSTIQATVSKNARAREVIIDTDYLTASMSGWKKKKRKEDTVQSPSVDITTEYLKRFCPPSAVKKSTRKSAKKPPRKSVKKSISEPEPEVEEEVEDDEIASLLLSKKKSKKVSKEDEEVKIPTKRKRLPTNDAFLETTISPHFEDEPSQNIKGGRVLRPRRKIKF